MSAKKQYYDNYYGKPYTEAELKEQSDYWLKYLEDEPSLPAELYDRWRPYFGADFVTFMLVSYENCGATYGIQLRIDKGEKYTLQTYEESGYSSSSSSTVIKSGVDISEINSFIIGFEPTRYIFD